MWGIVCVLGAWCIFLSLALHCVQVTVAFQDLSCTQRELKVCTQREPPTRKDYSMPFRGITNQYSFPSQGLPGLDCLISKFFDLPFAKALRHQPCISNVGKYPHLSPPRHICWSSSPLANADVSKGFQESQVAVASNHFLKFSASQNVKKSKEM